ncbi:MAG: CPBP family intramembrane metalloprotease [Muribaculaceae bacterium]
MSQIKFLVPPGRRILMLLLTYIVGFVVTGFAASLLLKIGSGGKELAMLRISAVVQDIFMFILPPVITALIITRQPVKLLALGKGPTLTMLLMAVAVMIVSSPFMSWIIELNQSIHLPESLATVEAAMRTMEDNAASAVESMLGPSTPGNLIVNVLLIGIMAGFSEELFFRGGLQRLLSTTRMSPWAAVWISAIVFSALHMQFFGFVPRMLLGAFFGYLLVWSGSVWLPIALHAFNNSMFVILKQVTGSGEPSLGGAESSWYTILISAILTAAGLWLLYQNRINKTTKL